MTERIYKCIREIYVDGVPQGLEGDQMSLRDWLIRTGVYDYSNEYLRDRSVIEYMHECKGKVLEEVC